MGALAARIQVTDEYGGTLSGLSSIYIWREEKLGDTSDTLTYYASRVPPAEFEWEYGEEMTFADLNTVRVKTWPLTPHVTFRHRYDEGAELCVARAILALTEAGMNV